MVSGSSSDQMPTIQVGALTAVCRQFADVDKNFKAQIKELKAQSGRLVSTSGIRPLLEQGDENRTLSCYLVGAWPRCRSA